MREIEDFSLVSLASPYFLLLFLIEVSWINALSYWNLLKETVVRQIEDICLVSFTLS